MTLDARFMEGQAYAWGREDASGEKTKVVGDEPTPSYAFGLVWSKAYQLYNAEKLTHMTNLRDAYKAWQESGGRTIWADQRDDERYRLAENEMWCEQHKAV